MDVRPLQMSDVSAAMRLSTQAGWNQIETDWQRLIALWPTLCFGGFVDHTLAATATIARFGSVGWVGMVLVDQQMRKHGFGGRMFEHVTNTAAEQGVTVLGLDATDLGQPVYRKQGFEGHSVIQRWIGSSKRSHDHGTITLRDEHWPDIRKLDWVAVGVDRNDLLRHLACEPQACMRLVTQQGVVTGFGLARRGRQAFMIGPVIADNRCNAAAIMAALIGHAHEYAPGLPVIIDMFESAEAVLPDFKIQRTLTRMSRPAVRSPLLTGPNVFAAAGFELG